MMAETLTAIDRFNSLIDLIETRCLAADGPVTPTLTEMREDELASIWRQLQIIRSTLSSAPAQAETRNATLSDGAPSEIADQRQHPPALVQKHQQDSISEGAVQKDLGAHPRGSGQSLCAEDPR